MRVAYERKTLRVGFGILIALCLAACHFDGAGNRNPDSHIHGDATKTATLTSTPTLTPTATATETPVSTATDEPLVCSIEDTLIQAKEMFPDRDVKFLSSIIEPLDLQQIALIIVDPDIPLVTSDTHCRLMLTWLLEMLWR